MFNMKKAGAEMSRLRTQKWQKKPGNSEKHFNSVRGGLKLKHKRFKGQILR